MKNLKLFVFFIIVTFNLTACSSGSTETTATSTVTETSAVLPETTATHESIKEPSSAESTENAQTTDNSTSASVETTSNKKDDIAYKVSSSVRSSTLKVDVSIDDISVNENLGTDASDDYIALIYLSFNAKNPSNTAKKMIDLINNEIAYNMAEVENISEISIFWTVPYLNSSDSNIAKASFSRNDDGFYFTDEWYDPTVFE